MRFVALAAVLAASGSAAAADCFKEISDATVCGTHGVIDASACGVEKIKGGQCGTKTVTDAAECGTKTVKSGAECGWDIFHDLIACGEDCVTGKSCTCKRPKECKVAKECKVDVTCEVAKKCKVASTCFKRVPGCELFPKTWEEQVRDAALKAHGERIRKLSEKVMANLPSQERVAGEVGDKVKKLDDTLAPYAVMIDHTKKRWYDMLDNPKRLEVVKKIILKAAKNEIDGEMKQLTREVAGWLAEPAAVPAKYVPQGWGKPGPVRQTATAGKTPPGTPGEPLPGWKPPAPLYPRVHSVTLGLGVGALVSGNVAIGAVFDDNGETKGVVGVAYAVGPQGKAGAELVYQMIPGDLAGAGGTGIGVAGDVAYLAGLVGAVEWSLPTTTPIPTWGLGLTFGVGLGIAYEYGEAFLFPSP